VARVGRRPARSGKLDRWLCLLRCIVLRLVNAAIQFAVDDHLADRRLE